MALQPVRLAYGEFCLQPLRFEARWIADGRRCSDATSVPTVFAGRPGAKLRHETERLFSLRAGCNQIMRSNHTPS